jgi:hypothetical protein
LQCGSVKNKNQKVILNQNTFHYFIDAKAVLKTVRNFVKQEFPKKNITPQDFRRIVATRLFAEKSNIPGKSMDETVKMYTDLINTSRTVSKNYFPIIKTCFQMLFKHYIRAVDPKRFEGMYGALSKVYAGSPEAIQAKKNLIRQMEQGTIIFNLFL